MTKTRRIIHHACWFAVLWPFIGAPLLVTDLSLHYPEAVLDFINTTSLLWVIPVIWLFNIFPMLVTGIVVAILPIQIYTSRYGCPFICAIIGGSTSIFFEFIPHGFSAHHYFGNDFLWIAFRAGAFAGLAIGLLLPALPGTKDTDNSPMKGIS